MNVPTKERIAEMDELLASDLTFEEWLTEEDMADLIAAAKANASLVEALTPSAGTKAAYIGEFQFAYEATDEEGEPCSVHQSIPWTTIKEIMAAIRARADLALTESAP